MTETLINKPRIFVDNNGNKFVKFEDWENDIVAFAKLRMERDAEIANLKQRLSEQTLQRNTEEPVFRDQAMPDARCTNPAENSENLSGNKTPIDKLYWETRAAIRNAILRQGQYKTKDTSELFEDHRTSGKTLWTLTSELEELLGEMIQQSKKPLLEELQNLRRSLSRMESERDREKWAHRMTLDKVKSAIGLTDHLAFPQESIPFKSYEEMQQSITPRLKEVMEKLKIV